MSEFEGALWDFDDMLWFIPFFLIIALGVYSTVRMKGIQFTKLGEMCRITFSREKTEKSKVTPFHVFCISMGNRIGIGNIAGPITAILTGGPGAIMWMWIFAALGGATSFVETTIGQIFKTRMHDDSFRGGPAYNISKGLGLKKMGIAMAFLMIMMYVVGYMSSEVAAISESFCAVFEFENNKLILAIAMTILTGIIVLGGFRRLAKASSLVVPFMAVAWFIMCIATIIINFNGVGNAFAMIFGYAFNPPAVAGGMMGALIAGMRRGIWSNEAGVGTITNVSSMADVEHPVKQGMSQSLGVLIDTIVCTMTALVILSFGDFDKIIGMDMDSMPLLQEVFGQALGNAAPVLVFFFVFLFSITCLMGDFVIGENNLKFITEDKKARIGIIVLILAVVFISCFYASDAVFAVLDILLGLCAIVNCIVIFRLFGRAVDAYRDYREQKAKGIEDPVFHRSALSDDTGVTKWDD